MRATTGRVLVLGSDTRSFLSVLRSLGRGGLEVHVASTAVSSPALRSKYIRVVHQIPQYRPYDSSWFAALRDLLIEHRFDLVVPCHDSDILPLHLHRKELDPLAQIYLLEGHAFDTCFDKRRTYELAERLGVSLPRQATARSLTDVESLVGEFGFPLVLKPVSSVNPTDPGTRHAVKTVWRREDVDVLPNSYLAREILVQQHFAGIGVGVEVLSHEGTVLVAFQHQRVHEPLAGGGSSYRKSVPLSPELLDVTRRLMRATSYTGVAMVEFRVNMQTRRWVLIEINGRFWGSLPLAISAGVDFPLYLYQMLCLGRKTFPQEYSVGIYSRNWILDIQWLIANLRANHSDPRLMTLPTSKIALEAMHLFKERSDTFVWDDVQPALWELIGFGLRHVERRAWKLRFIRCCLRSRVMRALFPARNVLFVCKGNICRSPFAEQYFRKLFGASRAVRSAGCLPDIDRPSPSEGLEAAKLFGIGLEDHRSRVVTEQEIALADVILVFERDQYEYLAANVPRSVQKVHYVGALLADGELEIRDPNGRDVSEFISVYRRIQEALSALCARAPETASIQSGQHSKQLGRAN